MIKRHHSWEYKFNKFLNDNKNLIILGGINLKNLNNLNMIRSNGLALLSEVKKSRLKYSAGFFRFSK